MSSAILWMNASSGKLAIVPPLSKLGSGARQQALDHFLKTHGGKTTSTHTPDDGDLADQLAAYDFERTATQAITAGSITNSVRTNVHTLHALFGPKVNITFGRTRFFALAKGGLVNFGVGGPVTAGAINNQIGNIIDGDKIGAFYPGGGVDFYIGRISFRAEAGDEIQFVHGGSTNNFRATIGPQLRF